MKMELQEIDLEELLEKSRKAYPDRKPTEKELEEIARPAVALAGLGIAETIALGTLLFAIWSHYNPRPDKSAAVCRKLYQGKKCGKKFIHTEKTNGYISSWCERKHETKLRIE
jgi:hypothetical protein